MRDKDPDMWKDQRKHSSAKSIKWGSEARRQYKAGNLENYASNKLAKNVMIQQSS